MKVESKMNKFTGLRFFNTSRVEVTENIKLGKTEIFKEYNDAYEFANTIRSYPYELRYMDSKMDNPKFYGYAVPK